MKFNIWYMKPEHFSLGVMGYDACEKVGKLPDPDNLEKTHVLLKEGVEAVNLERLYRYMQAENWSPNGEAKSLILSKGLQHTSMSIGDLVVDAKGKVTMVDTWGFKELTRVRPLSAKRVAS